MAVKPMVLATLLPPAVAEVQSHGFARRRARVAFGQHGGNVLAGNSVETVAAHTGFGQRFGQREHLGQRRVAAVKGGVEASHLWHLGHTFQDGADGLQVVRLVQRRQGNEFVQVGKNLLGYPHWIRVLHSPMDHAMAHAGQAHLIGQTEQESSQMLQRSLMAQLDSFAPGFFGDDLAAGILGDESRGGGQAFKLAAKLQFQGVALHRENRELHAR